MLCQLQPPLLAAGQVAAGGFVGARAALLLPSPLCQGQGVVCLLQLLYQVWQASRLSNDVGALHSIHAEEISEVVLEGLVGAEFFGDVSHEDCRRPWQRQGFQPLKAALYETVMGGYNVPRAYQDHQPDHGRIRRSQHIRCIDRYVQSAQQIRIIGVSICVPMHDAHEEGKGADCGEDASVQAVEFKQTPSVQAGSGDFLLGRGLEDQRNPIEEAYNGHVYHRGYRGWNDRLRLGCLLWKPLPLIGNRILAPQNAEANQSQHCSDAGDT
mmetsp:Transcript_63727/g.113372  ORF Transcript_63727/g.113372 Transcript_63727/m.113372 type:complete len:269 (+) Transcript_63727:1353-2159(+)